MFLLATYISNAQVLSRTQTYKAADRCKIRLAATAMTSDKDSPHRTVLIVEDAEDARHFMRLELEHLGYLVVEAENGLRAVELARQDPPDIILMDLSLPGLDGIAATERIRASDGLGKIPIIAVTAHQERDFREGAKAAGFDAYLTKPVNMAWLSELIKGLLPSEPNER